MLIKVELFFKYLRYILKAKKNWSSPSKSQILIYDESGINMLSRYFQKWNPEVLHVRGEIINIRVLIGSLFKNGNAHDAYVDQYIRIVKPDLVITFIDNNLNFLAISQRHKSLKTLFIQNGMRYYHGDIFYALDSINPESLKNLKVDKMLTFGQITGSHYKKYISGSYIPVGSVTNNLVPRQIHLDTDIIAFISQFKGGRTINGKYYDYNEYAALTVKNIMHFLKKYTKLKRKKLMIIPRFHKDSISRKQEEEYYDKLLGYKTEFLEFDQEFSSYHACDMAEIVVSVDSTLGIESIARGNKTALFSVRGEIFDLEGFSFGWPSEYADQGPFWTNNSNNASLETVLDYLLEIDNVQWEKDIKNSNFSSLMNFDKDNSILKMSINDIMDELNAK